MAMTHKSAAVAVTAMEMGMSTVMVTGMVTVVPYGATPMIMAMATRFPSQAMTMAMAMVIVGDTHNSQEEHTHTSTHLLGTGTMAIRAAGETLMRIITIIVGEVIVTIIVEEVITIAIEEVTMIVVEVDMKVAVEDIMRSVPTKGSMVATTTVMLPPYRPHPLPTLEAVGVETVEQCEWGGNRRIMR